jgi:hypothetical protein
MMTIDEIQKAQTVLSQSREEKPELKARLQAACTRWAENSRKYGIVAKTKFFHKGV